MARDAYVEQMKAQLDRWNAKLDEWEAKAHQAQADQKIGYEKKLAELRSKRDETQSLLAELRPAGEDAWTALQDGVNKAMEELKQSLDRAASEFK